MKKKNIVARSVLLVVISLLLGLGIYQWNAKTLSGNVMPMPFGIGMAVVVSGSMEPTLSVNDLIVVKDCDTYAVGDIVVYQDGYLLVVHRIIAIEGDTVQTQGDANNTPDKPINLSHVKGKVIGSLAGVGIIVSAIKTPLGTLFILAIAGFLLWRSYQIEKTDDEKDLNQIREEIEKLKKELETTEPDISGGD